MIRKIYYLFTASNCWGTPKFREIVEQEYRRQGDTIGFKRWLIWFHNIQCNYYGMTSIAVSHALSELRNKNK